MTRAFFEIGGRVDAQAADADWAVASRKYRTGLAEIRILDTALQAGIADLRVRLKDEGGSPVDSRLAGYLRLQLLDLYSQAADLQTARAAGAMAYATALYPRQAKPSAADPTEKCGQSHR